MKLKNIFPAVIGGAIVAVAVLLMGPGEGSDNNSSVQQSVYDRVIKSGVLRCGYAVARPMVEIDPETQKPFGLMVDLTNRLGQLLDLDVQWEVETGWGDIPAALGSGKIDVSCAGQWTDPVEARYLQLSDPLLYQDIEIYVRVGDDRFDNNLNAINDPSTTIIVLENDNSDALARIDFPNAKTLALSSISSNAEMYESLAAGKGDVVFTQRASIEGYMENNPGKLRQVKLPALRTYGIHLSTQAGEAQLMHMLNTAILELQNSAYYQQKVNEYLAKYPSGFKAVKR